MAIYNDVLTKIAAGQGITFSLNSTTGAIVISSAAGPSPSTSSAIAVYADNAGNLANSSVLVDSSSNVSGVGTLTCNGLTLGSSGSGPSSNYKTVFAGITFSAQSGLSIFINYVFPSLGSPGDILAINSISGNTASLNWVSFSSGGVISVQGTPGFITASSGPAPVINIDPNYAGQTSINTLGTIVGTAEWNATPIQVAYGGTGTTSLTTNTLLVGNGTNAIQTLATGTVGQVLKSGGNSSLPVWGSLAESDISGLTSDLSACEKFINKGALNGYCGLDDNSLISLSNLPSIPEAYIANLPTDLAKCEKTANKNIANGYCPLDNNSFVPIANIPALPESQITNLITNLAACEKTANKGIANGYCQLDGNSLVPVANIPALTESQITNLTSDLAKCEKLSNKGTASGYCGLDTNSLVPIVNIPSLPESTITNLTLDLAKCEKIASKGIASGYCPLDVNSFVPLTNLASSVLSNAKITSPQNNQVLQYSSSLGEWVNTSLILDTTLASLSDVSIITPSNNQFFIYNSATNEWNNAQGDHAALLNIGINTHAQIDSFISSKGQASGLASLDNTGKLSTLQTPINIITTINGLTTTNNALIINLENLNDVSVSTLSVGQILTYANPSWIAVSPSISILSDFHVTSPVANQGLIFNNTQGKWINQQIDHTTLNNVGTNTHPQIDTFINSEGRPNGLATLNNSGELVSAQLPTNVITSINTLTTSNNSLTLNIENLNDVLVSTPTVGQVLEFNGTKWINSTITMTTALAALTDCSISSPTNNQILQYNSSTSTWSNVSLNLVTALASLSDCTISSPVANQLLQYNGSKWVNATISSSTSLSSLTDCSVSGVANDQLLVYTTAGSLNKWVPYTLSGAIFNDATNTITVSGTTALAGLTTDVTIGTGASAPTANQTLVFVGGSTNKWENQQLSHGALSNIGVNTHAQLDTFVASTGNSNGLATLDSSSKLTSSQIPISVVTTINGLTTTNNTLVLNLANMADCSGISGATNDQLLVYTTSSSLNGWTPYTLNGAVFNDTTKTITVSAVTALSALTDCSTSGVINDQLLVYTTASSLNKWTPYTLSGAIFNDTTKTITVSATGGVTSVSGTTGQITVTNGTTTPVISISSTYAGQNTISTLGLITTGTWNGSIISGAYGGTGVNNGTNTITLGGNISTAGAITLSGAYGTTITVTGTTSITLPTSGTLATTSQIPSFPVTVANGGTGATSLTAYGLITGGTTTTGAVQTIANSSTAKQLLTTGTSSTLPSWVSASLSGGYISDVVVSSISSGDVLRYNSTTGQWGNSNTLTVDENTLTGISNTIAQVGVVVKTSTGIVQNGNITTSYVDGTDATTATITLPAGAVQLSSLTYHTNSSTLSIGSGTNIVNTANGFELSTSNITDYCRVNAKLSNSYVMTGFVYSLDSSYGVNIQNVQVTIYGSNNVSYYNDTSSSTTGLTQIYTGLLSVSSIYPSSVTINISNSYVFQYLHIFFQNTVNGTAAAIDMFQNHGFYQFKCSQVIINGVEGIDFSVSANAANGAPVITYLDSLPATIKYNENTLLLSEAYRRLYPVVRDTNTLNLGSGAWTIANSNGMLQYNSNIMTLDSYGNLSVAGTCSSNKVVKRATIPTSSPYTITKNANNYVMMKFILVNTLSTAYTITLPTTPNQNTKIIVADLSSNAATKNITVSPSGSDTVTNGTINTNGGMTSYVYSGTQWTGTAITTLTIDTSDSIVLCDTSSGAYTLYLPSSPPTGMQVTFKDTGNAATNNVTINGNENNIDGTTTSVINTNYGKVTMVFDTNQWFVTG